jgi:hypothetical protein
MSNPIITKIAYQAYQLRWPTSQSGEVLDISFYRFNEHYNLDALPAPYVLQHWQGRPVGYRGFGYYCSASDNYYSNYRTIIHETIPQILELPDSTSYRPVAVNIFYRSKVEYDSETIKVVAAPER